MTHRPMLLRAVGALVAFVALCGVELSANTTLLDDCGEYCDRGDGFHVSKPDKWSFAPEKWKELSADEPTPPVAVRVVSNNRMQTGANCPIVSVAIKQTEAWSGIKVNSGALWRDALALTGYTVVDSPKEVPGNEEHLSRRRARHMYSYVEFAYIANGARLRARQAIFWVPSDRVTDKDGPHYVAARMYFVNCTAKDWKNLADPNRDKHAQDARLFASVFESFSPKKCFVPNSGGQPVCVNPPVTVSNAINPNEENWQQASNEAALLPDEAVRGAANAMMAGER